MPPTSEAACLLQSGAMYHRRLGLTSPSGGVIFAGVKPGAVSIYFGDEPIYHFDLDGRWQRAFVEGTHYLKGLDATVRSVDRPRESSAMVLRRQKLPFADAGDLDASIRSVALGLIDDLDSGRLAVLERPFQALPFAPEEFRGFLERVASWDSAAWFAHRERYLGTYGVLPFVPPDCPNALVLQATLGDAGAWAFGRAEPTEHYVRSPGEFREHCQAVAALTGRRLAQHRGVFLAGADVLRRPVADVLEYLGAIAEAFPAGEARAPIGDAWDDGPARLGPVHAFLDDFAPPLPDLDGWRRLRLAGLGRVTLGVESGHRSTLAMFAKGWEDEALRMTVADLKAAGIGVGLVALVLPWDRGIVDLHVEATATLIGSLALDRGDLVSLVDVQAITEDPGPRVDTADQVAAIRARLKGGPKVVAYDPIKRWA